MYRFSRTDNVLVFDEKEQEKALKLADNVFQADLINGIESLSLKSKMYKQNYKLSIDDLFKKCYKNNVSIFESIGTSNKRQLVFGASKTNRLVIKEKNTGQINITDDNFEKTITLIKQFRKLSFKNEKKGVIIPEKIIENKLSPIRNKHTDRNVDVSAYMLARGLTNPFTTHFGNLFINYSESIINGCERSIHINERDLQKFIDIEKEFNERLEQEILRLS